MHVITSVDIKPLLMVSNSEIETFKRCRRKWQWGSFNRGNLVPKMPNLKFWIGTGCHHALERYHGYNEDPIEAFKQWSAKEMERIFTEVRNPPAHFKNDLTDSIELAIQILSHYLVYTAGRPKYGFTYIATEYEFSVPIPGTFISLNYGSDEPFPWVVKEWGVAFWEHPQFKKLYVDRGLYDEVTGTIPALYIGRLDGLVYDHNNHVHVIDHKFMAALVDPAMLLIDRQTARYVWAAQVAINNGWWKEVPQRTEVRGALYNVVRKKAPAVPPLLAKSGSTSANKSIDTTYEVYRATLIQRGEDPKSTEFKEVLAHLRKQDKFFQLLSVERGEEELLLIGENLGYEWEDMCRVATEAVDASHPALYPSPKQDCPWTCSYKDLCYVANYSGDIQHMIDNTMVGQKRTDLYSTQVEEV